MQSRVAILIDAENLAATNAAQIFSIAASYGMSVLRRSYGDFAKGAGATWLEKASLHAVDTVQVCSPAKGKNSSDMRMTIDAVEISAAGRADTFCLVSGDADFTPLAVYLRGAGKQVIGLGCENASRSFQQSCDAFHVINLSANASQAKNQSQSAKPPSVAPTTSLLPLVQDAIRLLGDEVKGGWISLGRLGAALRVSGPGFQLKHYGGASLKKVLAKEPALELAIRDTGDFVRVRPRIAFISA
ncbi:NYN domain-containing protein [Rhizobium sp. Leaf453]|uniref:NYN domain-containing protein n=2 Tax=unclassified Rhizobium TaxID=2613769 RepID=UPI001AEC8905|nr:NYN domain-containing protein [Rhizobium sp. Leaf453]